MKIKSKGSILRRTIVAGLISFLLLATFPAPLRPALLRGRLDRIYPNGQRGPLAGVRVTAYRPDIGRSSPCVTDSGGMYYLNVPAGNYYLEVWVSNPPKAYRIAIYDPVTDIPPIVV